MAAVVEARRERGLSSTVFGLPLDDEARFACRGTGIEEEVDGLVYDYVAEEVLDKRFTGLVCVRYSTGYRLGLVVLDGTVFGAWFTSPGGNEYWGEEALNVAEALLGPARVRFIPRPAYELV